MWEGIKVNGAVGNIQPAQLYVTNNSFIEDADTAVASSYSPTNANNILVIENSIFNKNVVAVSISNKTNYGLPTLPYTFRGNVFTSRNFNTMFSNYPFNWPTAASLMANWYPGSDYLPPVQIDDPTLGHYPMPCNNSQPAKYGIKLDNVGLANYREVVVGEIPPFFGFTNQTENVFDYLEVGIYADRSNLTSINNTFMHMQGQMMSYGPLNGTGIYAKTPLLTNYRLRVIRPNWYFTQYTNRFYDCVSAVEAYNYRQVIGEDAVMVSNHDAGTPAIGVYGYLLQTPSYNNYIIDRNKITNIENGITFMASTYNPGPGEYQQGGAVRIVDNTIQAAFTTPTTQYLTNAIWAQNLASCYTCGYSLIASGDIKILNNNIRNTRRGIFASNFQLQPVRTIGNHVTMEDYNGFQQYGINHTRCLGSNIIQNEVAGPGPGFNNSAYLFRAIQVVRGNRTVVRCNYTANTNIGFEFNGLNPNTTWRQNEMRNHEKGMLLNNSGDIGQQGSLGDAIENIWDIIGAFSWTGTNYHTFTDNFSPSATSPLYVVGGGLEEPINNSGNPGFSAYLFNSTYFNTTASGNNGQCAPFDYIALETIGGGDDGGAGGYYRMAQDDMNFTVEADRQNWNAQVQTWQTLLADTTLTDTSTVLQEFKYLAEGSRYAYITNIESEAASANFSAAEALIDDDNAAQAIGDIYGTNNVLITDVNAADNIVENNRSYFAIYVRYMQDSLLNTDTADVLALAEKCPLTEGDIVYSARALYNSITHAMQVFTDSCVLDTADNGGFNARQGQREEEKQRRKNGVISNGQYYTVSPNPVTDGNITLRQQAADEGPVTFEIYNALSQQVYESELTFKEKAAMVTLKSMKPGLYLLRLQDSKGKVYTLKLTVL